METAYFLSDVHLHFYVDETERLRRIELFKLLDQIKAEGSTLFIIGDWFDFYFEYKGLDGRYHNYHPDFVIRLKSGKFYIVEIKSEREIAHPIDGQAGAKAMALKELETLNEKQFKYEIIFTPLDSIPTNKLEHLRQFIGI